MTMKIIGGGCFVLVMLFVVWFASLGNDKQQDMIQELFFFHGRTHVKLAPASHPEQNPLTQEERRSVGRHRH